MPLVAAARDHRHDARRPCGTRPAGRRPGPSSSCWCPVSARSPMWSRCWSRTGWAAGRASRRSGRIAQGAQSRKALSRALRRGRDRRHDREPRGARRRVPALGQFEEAKRHFEVILARPMGDEPVYMVGKARAQFGLGQAADTVATLDDCASAFRTTSRRTRICSMPARSKPARATTRRCRSTGRCPTISSARRRACAMACCSRGSAAKARPRPGSTEVLTQLRRAPGACAQGAGRMDRAGRKGRAGLSLAPVRHVRPEPGAAATKPFRRTLISPKQGARHPRT